MSGWMQQIYQTRQLNEATRRERLVLELARKKPDRKFEVVSALKIIDEAIARNLVRNRFL